MIHSLLEPKLHCMGIEEPRVVHARTLVKVLHLINGEHYAGAEKVQDLLAQRMPDHGFAVQFACVKAGRFDAARRSGVVLHETPMQSRFDLRPAWALARLIRDESFSLIHTHTPRTALVGHLAARLANVPYLHHVHGQTACEMKRRLFGRFSAAVERTSLRHAARIIAVSESSRRYLAAQGLPADRLDVVPNGVPARSDAALRRGPTGTWTIGTVALFRPRKGTEVLLESIARLRREHAPVRLRVVGRFETPAYQHQIRARIKQLGIEPHVDLVGFTTDVAAELQCMDVLVLPSLLAEGLPMVIIEAMAAGVPVVGTRVDGIVDVIQDERTGLLAEPGDAASLAQQLARLIQRDVNWDSLRDNALRCHAARFSDRQMAAKVAGIYRRVLNLPDENEND